MARILVVDDSAVDRRLVGGLLESGLDVGIDFAANGRLALAQIANHDFDLVLTDLIMPEVDGLDLVAQIVEKYPLIPVILMTGRGSEQIAVRALESGASSYVPKRQLHSLLVDTVRNVLAVSAEQRCEARLMRNLDHSDLVFSLGADPCVIPPLINHLQRTMRMLGVCEQSDEIRVCVALEEAINNAMFHGNLEIDSETRTGDTGNYRQLVERRCNCQPYCDRSVYVEARMSRSEARFIVRDEGGGFNPDDLPDPTDPVNLEKACGRGLLLMRTFMDEVAFNASGNEVTMIKRAAKTTSPDPLPAHSPTP